MIDIKGHTYGYIADEKELITINDVGNNQTGRITEI